MSRNLKGTRKETAPSHPLCQGVQREAHFPLMVCRSELIFSYAKKKDAKWH